MSIGTPHQTIIAGAIAFSTGALFATAARIALQNGVNPVGVIMILSLIGLALAALRRRTT